MHWRAERAAKQRAEPYINEGIKVYKSKKHHANHANASGSLALPCFAGIKTDRVADVVAAQVADAWILPLQKTMIPGLCRSDVVPERPDIPIIVQTLLLTNYNCRKFGRPETGQDLLRCSGSFTDFIATKVQNFMNSAPIKWYTSIPGWLVSLCLFCHAMLGNTL